MITCELFGGLGNQLFILFACISYAIENNQPFFFYETIQIRGITKRNTYWRSIFNKLNPYLLSMENSPHIDVMIKEEEMNTENCENKNVLLYGYFQSDKYFKKYLPLILKLLEIEEQKQVLLTQNKFFSQNILNKCISIHFRLGDYIHMQQYHNLLTFDYYKKALEYMLSKIDYQPIFLYFCEDKDIENVNKILIPLKKDFPKCIFHKINSLFLDWEQMLLMSSCKHHIIANSTFSWWAAYLNSYTEKIVCYPSQWLGPKNKYSIDELFPEKWIKIEII